MKFTTIFYVHLSLIGTRHFRAQATVEVLHVFLSSAGFVHTVSASLLVSSLQRCLGLPLLLLQPIEFRCYFLGPSFMANSGRMSCPFSILFLSLVERHLSLPIFFLYLRPLCRLLWMFSIHLSTLWRYNSVVNLTGPSIVRILITNLLLLSTSL